MCIRDRRIWATGFAFSIATDDVYGKWQMQEGLPGGWIAPTGEWTLKYATDVLAKCNLQVKVPNTLIYYPDLMIQAYEAVSGEKGFLTKQDIDLAMEVILSGLILEYYTINCKAEEPLINSPCWCPDCCKSKKICSFGSCYSICVEPCQTCSPWPCNVLKIIKEKWKSKVNESVYKGIIQVKDIWQPYQCIDEDGLNFEIRGKVTKGDLVLVDKCKDLNTLIEYYCSNGEINQKEVTCTYGCEAGKCNPACFDSDSLNYWKRGWVKQKDELKIDYCKDKKILIEYSCQAGKIVPIEHECRFFCYRGRCTRLLPDSSRITKFIPVSSISGSVIGTGKNLISGFALVPVDHDLIIREKLDKFRSKLKEDAKRLVNYGIVEFNKTELKNGAVKLQINIKDESNFYEQVRELRDLRKFVMKTIKQELSGGT